AAKKTAAKKTAAKKTAAKKTAAKKTAAKKTAAKKTAAKKTVAVEQPVAKQPSAKRAAKTVAVEQPAKEQPVAKELAFEGAKKSAARRKKPAAAPVPVDEGSPAAVATTHTAVASRRKKATPPQGEAVPRLPVQTELPLGVSRGDKLPVFELPDQDGRIVKSADLVGQPFVLYFYPKDDTPGCTKEACGFKDEQPAFSAAGVRVIGVSPDKPASHKKFRAKYGLEFTLLSDTHNVLSQALGVWKLKNNYGREYMGIERATFLVDAAGRIQRVWRQVRVAGHVPEVLELAKDARGPASK
ncbi:MAG: hypothetical protein RJA70_822, partial [Pseudomonadota bacterium]